MSDKDEKLRDALKKLKYAYLIKDYNLAVDIKKLIVSIIAGKQK